MTVFEAIKSRHSVRSYLDKPLSADIVQQLNDEISACNSEGHLHIQLISNEPKAFDSMMAHYGKFSGVENYIALVGKKSTDLEEKLGYYGERIVLKAQTMGLNTCWVAMSFSKNAAKKNIRIHADEKLVVVISLGYGAVQGVTHKSKPIDELCSCNGNMPDWFKEGIESAALAPTAMNQQKFKFILENDRVSLKNLGGFYSKVDKGIVKYHFEIASGRRVE